ncbi:unnamed protein product, partial [Rotaria sp. Silwood1]
VTISEIVKQRNNTYTYNKLKKMNNITKECPDVSVTTNYGGYCYFGEYPLSFAAVLQQEKSVRLLVAKDADTNCQD